MPLKTILHIVIILFPVSEILLAILKRADKSSSINADKGSLWLLWGTIIIVITADSFCNWHPFMELPFSGTECQAIALGLLLVGLAIRWFSILSLGKMFTVNVAIQSDHVLYQQGFYKFVRHPSYTGLLIAFLGLAIDHGTWIDVAIIMIPITAALFYRILKEEEALIGKFGKQYEEYAARTKRLIPGIV